MLQPRKSSLLLFYLQINLFLGLSYAGVADFSSYPTASQSCLSQAATSSKCDDSTVPKFNACVCSNGGGFVDSSAKCIGSSDPNDLTAVYNTMSSNCAGSNTPLVYTLDKFLSVAAPAAVTTVTTPTTAAPTLLSTVVQTIVAPTGALATAAIVSTVTLQPLPGQTTAKVSVMTLTPGQTATWVSVVTLSTAADGKTTVAGLSPTTIGTSPNTASQSATSSNSSGQSLSTGAIVGLAVGIPVFLALAGILIFLIMRSRKQPTSASNGHQEVSAVRASTIGGDMYKSSRSSVATFAKGPDIPPYPPQQYPQPSLVPEQPNYQRMSYQQPVPYGQNPHYVYPQQVPHVEQPISYNNTTVQGRVELQGPVVARPQELPGY